MSLFEFQMLGVLLALLAIVLALGNINRTLQKILESYDLATWPKQHEGKMMKEDSNE